MLPTDVILSILCLGVYTFIVFSGESAKKNSLGIVSQLLLYGIGLHTVIHV